MKGAEISDLAVYLISWMHAPGIMVLWRQNKNFNKEILNVKVYAIAFICSYYPKPVLYCSKGRCSGLRAHLIVTQESCTLHLVFDNHLLFAYQPQAVFDSILLMMTSKKITEMEWTFHLSNLLIILILQLCFNKEF